MTLSERIARAGAGQCDATYPMAWDATERYQCSGDHRYGRHHAYSGQTRAGVVHMGAEWSIEESTLARLARERRLPARVAREIDC